MSDLRALPAALLWMLIAVVAAGPSQAQTTPEAKAKMAIGAALRSAFPLPLTDIRTQRLTGQRLVLKKGTLVMSGDRSVDNVYANGKIQLDGKASGQVTAFQAGAQFFVVGISVNSGGVGFMLISPDQTLGGNLKFPFRNGAIPPVGEVFAQIGQVFSADRP